MPCGGMVIVVPFRPMRPAILTASGTSASGRAAPRPDQVAGPATAGTPAKFATMRAVLVCPMQLHGTGRHRLQPDARLLQQRPGGGAGARADGRRRADD